MIPTIIYLISMIWIPRTFKKVGIEYAVQNRIQGVMLIALAHTLRWMLLLNLLVFWLPDWQTYWTILCLIGLVAVMYKEKKYLLFDFHQTILFKKHKTPTS